MKNDERTIFHDLGEDLFVIVDDCAYWLKTKIFHLLRKVRK